MYREIDKWGRKDPNFIPKKDRIVNIEAVGFPRSAFNTIGFPPAAEKPPDPRIVLASSAESNIRNWLHEIPEDQSPVPFLPYEDDVEKEKRLTYERSFRPANSSVNSSFIRSSESEHMFVPRFRTDFERDHKIVGKTGRSESSDEQRKPFIRKIDLPEKIPPVSKLAAYQKFDRKSCTVDVLTEIPKFKRRDDEEDEEMKKTGSVLSQEAVEMGSEDNKFEASELIEFRDHSWTLAVPIDRERTDDKNVYRHLVFSYQSGIDRILLTVEQTTKMGNTVMIKYRRTQEKCVEMIPIYSALPSTGLMSLKYRHNKGIEMRLYGIVNFVDFVKDVNHPRHRSVVWTDALGPLYLSAADRSNIRRKLMGTEEKIFAPLRMCMITVKGDFTLSAPNGFTPKWQVVSFQPLIEEGSKDPNIGRNLWPARVLRFDDLVTVKSISGETWLRSLSNSDVRVLAGPNLTGILLSAGPTYADSGVMQGFVVPFFIKHSFAYYEALIVGPPRVVMMLTEGRFLNYCPKTWPPSIEEECARYRRENGLKMRRNEPRWTVPRNPADELKTLSGAHEFHFDFRD